MAKNLIKLLERALLDEGKMNRGVYEYELEEQIPDFIASMKKDKDEYIFAITEQGGEIAMILVELSGKAYINEEAREKLKSLWQASYVTNLQKLIPDFVDGLVKGELPVAGVHVKK